MAAIEPAVKKTNASRDFRSFMKSQKVPAKSNDAGIDVVMQ